MATVESSVEDTRGDESVLVLCPNDVQEKNTIAHPLSAAIQRFFWVTHDEAAIVWFVGVRMHATPNYKHLCLDEILEAMTKYVHDIRMGKSKKLFNAYVADRVPPIDDPWAIIPISHEAIDEMLARAKDMRIPVP